MHIRFQINICVYIYATINGIIYYRPISIIHGSHLTRLAWTFIPQCGGAQNSQQCEHAHVPGIYNLSAWLRARSYAREKWIAVVMRPRTSLINRGNRVNEPLARRRSLPALLVFSLFFYGSFYAHPWDSQCAESAFENDDACVLGGQLDLSCVCSALYIPCVVYRVWVYIVCLYISVTSELIKLYAPTFFLLSVRIYAVYINWRAFILKIAVSTRILCA